MVNIYTDSENGYDGIANEYERWCTGDDNYEPSLKFYLEYLEAHNGPFLELGIGTGRIALEAIKLHPKHIVGVDISANMLKKCEEKYKKLKGYSVVVGTLQLIKQKIENIEFCEEFEVVYLPFRTVGHIMTDTELEHCCPAAALYLTIIFSRKNGPKRITMLTFRCIQTPKKVSRSQTTTSMISNAR